MRIPEFSVRRPVTVLMLILIIVVLGAISFIRLPIELMPDLTYPVAAVITSYEGVASEDIETLVTKPIDAAVSKVKNVKTVSSTSQEGIDVVCSFTGMLTGAKMEAAFGMSNLGVNEAQIFALPFALAQTFHPSNAVPHVFTLSPHPYKRLTS